MKTLSHKMADSYFDLVRQFPLVPIKSERHYDSAIAFIQPLAVQDEKSLDSGERDYLDALTRFVEDYEQQHHQIEVEKFNSMDALRYLMKQNEMKAIDLGKVLGSRSVASQILGGKRGLSKRHIILLAEHFKVEPGLFLERD